MLLLYNCFLLVTLQLSGTGMASRLLLCWRAHCSLCPSLQQDWDTPCLGEAELDGTGGRVVEVL